MVHKASVKKLVKPLRKLSFLSTNSKVNLSLVPEEDEEQQQYEYQEQNDILTRLPYELALYIFSLLCFEDLVRVQLTCRLWCRIAHDSSLWKARCLAITQQHTDLSFDDFQCNDEQNDIQQRIRQRRTRLSWPTRYCQLQTKLNWKLGAVQQVHLINQHCGRILSVKLKENMLAALSEDNMVRLYENKQHGFKLRHTWQFGDPQQQQTKVECIDLLPEINIMAVALHGSKCMFYDISKNSTEPIQVLKGGTHAWFVPDSISLSRDYFAVSGRKPSAVFVWKWRKGVRLSNKAFDNQPHSVHISGDHLITASVDGTIQVFDILDEKNVRTFRIPPCSIPSLDYDGGLCLSVAPFTARSLYQYAWQPHHKQKITTETIDEQTTTPSPSSSSSNSSSYNNRLEETDEGNPTPQPSTSAPHPSQQQQQQQQHGIKRRLSSPFGFLSSTKNKRYNTAVTIATNGGMFQETSSSLPRLTRIRRHSSYNDYGYACQARTEQYIKQKMEQGLLSKTPPTQQPDFNQPLILQRTIRTTPLGFTSLEIVNVASYQDRIGTVNRHGDIAIYKKDGTMAARVQYHGDHAWMEDVQSEFTRDDDDYSDGYNFMKSRLAIGSTGLVYGGRNGSLWWLDFAVKPNV